VANLISFSPTKWSHSIQVRASRALWASCTVWGDTKPKRIFVHTTL